jgi:integrase
LGLFKRKDSRFWWMGYTLNGGHHYESTKTTSKDLAIKVWKHRESEITLRLFKVGWQGERIAFGQLCEEFERSHFAGLAANTVRGHRTYIKNLKAFFGDCKLGRITVEMIEKYRDQSRQQPTKRGPNRKVNGATVNRELECLKCVLDLACKRKYIPENPASSVKHFNELRERPVRRMLTVEEEQRILEAAPPHLRVAIVLLTQTGGRTYSEGFSLRWDQVDFSSKLIRLGNDVKTPGSSEPVPLSEYACEVLQAWKKEQASNSPFLFPSPICPERPISTVKTAWRATLRRAEIPHFSLYTLRHIFCTRLSEVAPDAVVQRAMRHSSPETKRRYQLGMANQVRQAVEKANESAYGKGKRTTFLLRSASVGIGGTEKRL